MRFDIHPKNKRPVGQRLAYLAENHVYGKHEITSDAPEPVGFQCDGTGAFRAFRDQRQLQETFYGQKNEKSGDII